MLRQNFVFILLLPFLAGCTSSGPDEEVPIAVKGFIASYRTENQKLIEIELGGPVYAADRDLTPRLAYVLDVSAEAGAFVPEEGSPGFAYALRYFIDADLLVVRVDDYCVRSTPQGCDESRVYAAWRGQGAPPPFGVLWPNLLDVEELPILGSLRSWNLQVNRTSEGFTARQDGQVPRDFLDLTGPFDFVGQSPVPAHFEGVATSTFRYSVSADLTSFTEGPILPPAEAWPKQMFSGVADPDRPTLFEGDDLLVKGRDFTHRQAFDRMLSMSSKARDTMAAGGCVASLAVMPESGRSGNFTPVTGPVEQGAVSTNSSELTFGIADASGRVQEYRLEHRAATWLFPENWTLTEEADDRRVDCMARSAVKPTMPFASFVATVQQLPVVGGAHAQSYGFVWSKRSGWSADLGGEGFYAGLGRIDYSAVGFQIMDQVYFDAGPGWWEHMYISRETMAAIDAGAPTPP